MKSRALGYALTMGATTALLVGCAGGSSAPLTPRVANANSPLAGAGERVIYSFTGGRDGVFPMAPLIVVHGLLYGTTSEGGGSYCNGMGCGTVFRALTTGGESKFYTFKGTPDGEFPLGRLTTQNGRWYGTTTNGGTNDDGTVFSVTGSGKERVLHSFQGHPDGSEPFGRLVSVNGTLYGTTAYGGKHNLGTVFAVTPSGSERVLYSFKFGTDGAHPQVGLTILKGILYGVTGVGGAYNSGTVFTITTSGKERVLYSFKYGDDGAGPDGELTAVAGELYGTTTGGGINKAGTVFEVSTLGKERIVHTFRGYPDDGSSPNSALIDVDGTLYGTADLGGRKDDGIVFSLTTSGKERILHSFSGSPDGKYPYGGLIAWLGTFYGVTNGGGTGPCYNGMGCGAIYALTP